MFGKEIKNLRVSLNFTQSDVSKATGIPQNTISWIESDKGIANIYQCVLLADFFNVSLDELIGREQKENNTYNNFGTHNGDVNFN